jgi:hypothetical protein
VVKKEILHHMRNVRYLRTENTVTLTLILLTCLVIYIYYDVGGKRLGLYLMIDVKIRLRSFIGVSRGIHKYRGLGFNNKL